MYLWIRKCRAKEDSDPIRFGERLGWATVARPRGFLIWLHGASVGELNSVRGLVARLRVDYPRAHILVTGGTVTSAKTAASLPAIHQYVPIDVPFAVRRFMRHWHPDLVIRVDSELWPIQLDALRRSGIPHFLINGAVTVKSFRRWKRRQRMARRMMASFTGVLAKSDKDAMRLASMGATNVMVINNLKYTNPPPADQPAERAEFQRAVRNRPTWHAAVLGIGESDTAYAAHRAVIKRIPDALLIITPRHPSMKQELTKNAGDLNIAFRSDGAAPLGDVYIADTLGEMGLFYRCADIAFMGRSLSPDCRGSSPIEAMLTGNVIATGRYTNTFDEVYNEMESAKILTRVSDATELSAWVLRMLGDGTGGTLRAATKKFATDKVSTIDTIMEQLAPYIR